MENDEYEKEISSVTDPDIRMQEFYKETRTILDLIERKHVREQEEIEKRYTNAIKIFLIHIREELEQFASKNTSKYNSSPSKAPQNLPLGQINTEYIMALEENKRLIQRLDHARNTIAEYKIRCEVDDKIRDFQVQRVAQLEGEISKGKYNGQSQLDYNDERVSKFSFGEEEFDDEITQRIYTLLKESSSSRDASMKISKIFTNFKQEIERTNQQKIYSERQFKSLQEKYCNLLSKQSNLFTNLKRPSELATIFNKCIQTIENNPKSETFQEQLPDETYLKILKEFLIQKPIQNLLGNFIKGKSCCSHEDCLNNLARKNLFVKSHTRKKSMDSFKSIHNPIIPVVKNSNEKQKEEQFPKPVPKLNKRNRSKSANINANFRIINKFAEAKKLIIEMNENEINENPIKPSYKLPIKYTSEGIQIPLKEKGQTFQKFFFKDKKEMFHIRND